MNLKEGFGIAENDHLSLYGVDLVSLCETYGTPLFVFDETRIRKNYQRFRDAFKKHYAKTIVCYSVKTANNLAICKIMEEEGAYAEVGAGLDFHIAKKVGFPPERIIFDGLYKSEAVLREALNYGVLLVNVESFSELDLLNRIAGEFNRKQAVGIRISTFPRKLLNAEMLYCNPLSRFGFSYEEAYVAFKRALELKNLEVKGIMIHPYWGIHSLLPFVRRIQTELNLNLQFINFGGGFQKRTRKIGLPDLAKDYLRQKLSLESKLDAPPKKIREIEEIGRLVAWEVKQTLGREEATLIFEPGRYIVHDAGFLLLRVGVIKQASGFKWIIVDGGTNLNSDWLERREMRVINRASAPATEIVNIVGPLLFARDFVTIKQRLPELREGDIIIVFDSGAYTLSNSTQFLNPRPCVVLLGQEGKVTKIREKETYNDVLRMDRNFH